MQYTTTCPVCLAEKLKVTPDRVDPQDVPIAVGVLTNDPFVHVTCPLHHESNIYPMDGLFAPMFQHALAAFSAGALYEASAAGYAALEQYMKNYILASHWIHTDKTPAATLGLVERQYANKFLIANSQRIMGAYTFSVQVNTRKNVSPHPFENLSHARDAIVHALEIPTTNQVATLLCGIYRHINHSIFDWILPIEEPGFPLFPVVPLFNKTLCGAKTFQALPDAQQSIIGALSPSISFVFDMHKIFENESDCNKYLKQIDKNAQNIDQLLKVAGIQIQKQSTPSKES